MRAIALAVTSTLLSACAPSPPRESVVMAVSTDEAHVRLGRNLVAVGDDVVFKRKFCEPESSHAKRQNCEMRVVGHARVTRFEGEEYAVVKVYEGTFAEGDVVEPVR